MPGVLKILWCTLGLAVAVTVLATGAVAHAQTRTPATRRLAVVEKDVDALTNLSGDLLRGFEQLDQRVGDLRAEIATVKAGTRKTPEAERLARLEGRLAALEAPFAASAASYQNRTKPAIEYTKLAPVSGRWRVADVLQFDLVEDKQTVRIDVEGPAIRWASGLLTKAADASETTSARGTVSGVFSADPSSRVRTAPVLIRQVADNVLAVRTEQIQWTQTGRQLRTPVRLYATRLP